MERVLITGGAGFIGFHLAKHLCEYGYNVDIADNFQRGIMDTEFEVFTQQAGCRVYNIDLTNPLSMEELSQNYNYIFHLAAIVGVKNVMSAPYDVVRINTASMINMLEYSKKISGLKRFIFSSTSEVYAGTLKSYGIKIPTPESTPLTIENPADPRSSYMLSKILGEALCAHSVVPCTSVRLHNVYGPRMGLSHVIPELLKKAHSLNDKESLKVYSPTHTRSFCYIDDAVEMFRLIIEDDKYANDVFNIGIEDAEISIKELAETILDVTSKKNCGLELMEDAQGSPTRRAPAMSKFLTIAGHREKTSLREGVVKTYQWYRSNVFEGGNTSAI